MRIALVVRALVGFWFAARIAGASSWLGSVEDVGEYLRIDGAIAIGVAGFFVHESIRRGAARESILALVLFVDGAGRLVSGIAAHVWPGLLEFPVTIGVFLGIMGMCTAAVGLAEGTLVIEEEVAQHGRWHRRPQFPAGPVGVASVLSIGFGVAAMLGVGDLELVRTLLVGHIGSVALVMVSLAARRPSRRDSSARSV
jgi:hypothetical protein